MAQRTEKIAESVARQILRDIKDKRLPAGATLPPEGAMLERFGIGRGSLREALRILEVNGLVTLKPGPGGGPVVAAHDPRNFGQMTTLHLQSIGANYRQLLDARVEYEVILARKAAEQEGDLAGQTVREAMDAEGHQSTEDQQYAQATSGFHQAVGLASGNPVIALAAESIYAIWSVRVTAVLYPPQERQQVSVQHEQITRAIEKHDAKRAERLMREHMRAYQDFCELRYPARMDDIVDWK
ncbi:DNA-binding FadR family transcriptional regulator [Kribbella sp. VKM Ac-2527]|uniref:DNA-binding FadR family transcriptional regulator n=1 Tax=Kribbella caucasensis TaxID=2512215 RepID=A0A4R6KFV0_9ACTN|nr:FCD domain-containing protein [Kribbella sp. VKM Ac-2527]TDO48720.1 DNA-binding FadR family transcriptional regulator [Kribbella sp. VKM Ac-2527]